MKLSSNLKEIMAFYGSYEEQDYGYENLDTKSGYENGKSWLKQSEKLNQEQEIVAETFTHIQSSSSTPVNLISAQTTLIATESDDMSSVVSSALGTFIDWSRATGINHTAGSWTNVTDMDSTVNSVMDYTGHTQYANTTGVNAIDIIDVPVEGDLVTKILMVLIPVSIILLLFAIVLIVLGLCRCKRKHGDILKNNTMNTEDLAFYQQVQKIPSRANAVDACSTRLPEHMPPFGYFDADKPNKSKSLTPALKTDLTIIPGYLEVLRVQLRPRRSMLASSLRAVQSSPDTVYAAGLAATDSHGDVPSGRSVHITTSSPAVLLGLWQQYRSEMFRQQNETANLCPIHAEIQSLMSGNTTADSDAGRVSPIALREESHGFDFSLHSSASSMIPRKITCRFCKDRAMGRITPLTTTPGTSPKAHRKKSHMSVIDSGLAAIADECGTLPTRALHSLDPVKIEHIQETPIMQTQEKPVDLYGRQPSTETPDEINPEVDDPDTDIPNRRATCRPDMHELQLEVFRSLLLKRPSDGSRSAGTMTSVSSSFFTSGKDPILPSSKSSTLLDVRKMSKKSLRGQLSDRQLRKSKRSVVLMSNSDHLAAASHNRHLNDSVSDAGLITSSSLHGNFSKSSRKDLHESSDRTENRNSSGDECGSGDDSHKSNTCDNPICKVHSLCQSIVDTVTSPSVEQVDSNEPLCSHHQGSLFKWTPRETSDNLMKSDSSTNSYQRMPLELAKSNSSHIIKWCFRKSKTQDGLRSPPELLPNPPSPPEMTTLTEKSRRPLLPDGDDVAEVENYVLLPSYYGTDSEDSTTDSDDELTWLQKN